MQDELPPLIKLFVVFLFCAFHKHAKAASYGIFSPVSSMHALPKDKPGWFQPADGVDAVEDGVSFLHGQKEPAMFEVIQHCSIVTVERKRPCHMPSHTCQVSLEALWILHLLRGMRAEYTCSLPYRKGEMPVSHHDKVRQPGLVSDICIHTTAINPAITDVQIPHSTPHHLLLKR